MTEFPSPIRDGEFVDQDGVSWRLRGGEVRWPRMRRLIQIPDAVVVHVYMSEIRTVPADERPHLLAQITSYMAGKNPPQDYTAFRLAEFKSETRSMVVVEETC